MSVNRPKLVLAFAVWESVRLGATLDDLTLSSEVMPNGYTSKCSQSYWSNLPFLIFLTFGHSSIQD